MYQLQLFGHSYSRYAYLCKLHRYIGGGVELTKALNSLLVGVERIKVLPQDYQSLWRNTDHATQYFIVRMASAYMVPSEHAFEQFHRDTPERTLHTPEYYRVLKEKITEWGVLSLEDQIRLGIRKTEAKE